LILYSAALLKLFMVSKSFGVEFFGTLRYKDHVICKRDSLTSSLPICIPFMSSCFITLARNSRTLLNKWQAWAPLSHSWL
jgi:hypothetical protein